MTKVYEKTIENETGKLVRIFREMSQQEQEQYDRAKTKKQEYLNKYSDNLELLDKDLEICLNQYNKLRNEIYPLEVEIDYLRYISKVVREAKGERVEWMGS